MSTAGPDSVLVRLDLTGQDSFDADEAWRDRIVGSLTCPHCRNIFGHVRRVDAVVSNRPRRTDVDFISPFCGGVAVVSTRFIDLVGLKQFERVAGLGRITDVNGLDQESHRTVVALHDFFLLRGYSSSSAALCRNCGRVLYGLGGERYAVRSNIPDEPFFVSFGRIFCTDKFWRDKLSSATLIRVEAVEYPIREGPEDGLPRGFPQLKAALRARKLFR